MSLQNKLEEVNSSVLVEMHKFSEPFSKLETELSVTEHINTFLSSSLVSIERQCWLNAQYSRREWLDIVGILSEVEADGLEEKVVAIFEKLGCNIPTGRIAACYRICKKSCTVIVEFSQRKDCQQVGGVKRDLRKIKRMLICLVKMNLSIKAYVHIIR